MTSKPFWSRFGARWCISPASESSHSARRIKRIGWTVVASLVSRGISYVVMIVMVPLTIHYLGEAQYGVWITLSTTLALLLGVDLGLGNSLRNMLGQSYGRDDWSQAQAQVATVFWFLLSVALAVMVVFIVVFPLIPWEKAFNAGSSVAAQDLNPSVLIVLLTFALRFPLSIVAIVYLAYQEGYIAAIWESLGGIVSLIAVYCVIQSRGSLPWLALALSGSVLIVNALSAVFLFKFHKPLLRPALSHFKWKVLRQALNLGLKYLLIQLAALIVYQTDTIVIAQVLGPLAVTEYNLAYRPFSLMIAIQSVFLAPLFSAYTEAVARGEWKWARRQIQRSVYLTLGLGGLALIALVLGGRQLIYLWTQSAVLPSQELLFVMGLWCLSYLWQSCFSVFLMGIGSVSLLSKLSVISAPLNLVLCILFAQRFGLIGIAVANLLTLLSGAIQGPAETWLRLRRLSQNVVHELL
jgi:O-antigen/teichoic acid export membrane protein